MFRHLVIFIVGVWSSIACATEMKINNQTFLAMQPNTSDFTRGFKALIQRVQMESTFFSFFLLRNDPSDCVDEQLTLNFELPFVQLNESNAVYVRGTGNSLLLAIVCVNNITDKDFLLRFAKDLQHIRSRHILVIHNRNLTASAQSDIVAFFHYCEHVKFLNVVLIHRDFATTHVYHSFNQFPKFALEIRDTRDTTPIYPNRLVNVGGKILSTWFDQIEPSTFFGVGADGAINVSGFIGYFIIAFAKRYNFTLQIPTNYYEFSLKHVVDMAEIRKAVRNGSIDVGASLLTPQKEGNLHGYIYPVGVYQLLTMLPVERTLETYQFFIGAFRPGILVTLFGTIWLLCFVGAVQIKLSRRDIQCNRALLLLLITPWDLELLRGLFCQASNMRTEYISRRMIFILIITLGGLMSNIFSTNLVKWLTVPPQEEPIVTFSQLAERNLQLQIAEPDVVDIKLFHGEDFWKEHSHLFKIVATFDEYQANIRKMDARYGYVLDTVRWPLIEQRQKYFTSPLFRLSNDLHYTKGAVLSLPVNENSMYKSILSDFILRSRESGLLSHWYDKTFFALVKLKRFNLTDLSETPKHDVLTLKEFEWIWLAYGIGIGLSILIFIFELYWKSLCGRAKAYWRQLKSYFYAF